MKYDIQYTHDAVKSKAHSERKEILIFNENGTPLFIKHNYHSILTYHIKQMARNKVVCMFGCIDNFSYYAWQVGDIITCKVEYAC